MKKLLTFVKQRGGLFLICNLIITSLLAQNSVVPVLPEGEKETIELLKRYETNLRFQENRGQWENDAILFRANNNQASFQFTPKGVSIGILDKEAETEAETAKPKRNPKDRRSRRERPERDTAQQSRTGFVWNLNFLDGNPAPKISGKHLNAAKINYITNQRGKTFPNTKSYEEVWYESVYDDIDARFYSNKEQQLEYDFIVHPHGSVADIHLEMEGIKDLSLNQNGEIVFQTPLGELKKGSPYTYQKINGQEILIDSRYVLEADNSIRFEVGDYDPNHPLVIDPIVLAYSTYLGSLSGTGRVEISSMCIDSYGNVLVTGEKSNSATMPVTAGTIQSTIVNSGFIIKFDPTLSTVLWGTYFIGTDNVDPTNIKVDDADDIYICGINVGSSLPTTPGVFQETPLSTNDAAWVGKLSADGSTLDYLTYVSGLTADVDLFDLEVDATGNVVVLGATYDTEFPTTSGVVKPTSTGGEGDWVILGLNPTGGLRFSTYLGGSGWEYNELYLAMELGPGGNIYIAGTTQSTDYPTTAGVYASTTSSSSEMGVITVLNPTATSFIYSTYIPGSYVNIQDLKVDVDGNAYVTGFADGTFDFTSGSYSQQEYAGFLVKMDASGNRVFSTALTVDPDLHAEGNELVLDEEGNIFVFGRETSGDFTGTLDGLNQTTPHSRDNFLLKFSSDGSERLYATSIITGDAIYASYDAMEISDCKLYFAGYTGSVYTNVTPNAYQKIKRGGDNGFVSIFDLALRSEEANTISPASQAVCSNGRTQAITGTDQTFLGSDHIKNESTYQQLVEVACQWQASNDNITWEDIPGAVNNVFLPAPTSTDVYYRRVCGTTTCDRDTSNVHAVLVGPDAAPTVASGMVNTCAGTPIQIGALATGGTGGSYTYSWSPATGLDNPNIAQPTATVAAGGLYNVIVTDADNGCEFEEQWQVNVVQADAGPDVSYCGAVAPIAIGTTGEPGLTYSWAVISGDPISSLSNPNIPQPLASPSVTTTYELTVTEPVTGCTTTDEVIVGNFPVTANAGVDETVCMGEDFVLGGEAAEAGYSYGWAPGIYISSQTTAQPTFKSSLCFDEDIYPQTNNPIEFTVTKIHDASGCKDVDTIQVYLLQTEMDDICGVPTMIGVQEDSCGLDLPGVNFTWSVISGDAASITGQENDRYPFVNPTSNTLYHLDVGLNGKTCSSEMIVTLDCIIGCSVNITAISDISCPTGGQYNTQLNGSVAMLGGANDNLPTGYHYEWSPTFALTAPNSLVTGVTTIPQDTTFYLSIIDESNGSTLCLDSIRVYASLAADPFAGLQVPDFICAGIPTMIGIPGVVGWDYQWSPTTGLSDPNISDPIATVSSNTTYTLTASDAVTGCIIDADVEVVVVSPIINAGPDGAFCENAVVQLGTKAIPGQTYSWEPAVGLAQPNIAQPLDTIFIDAQYMLTVTDTLTGCMAVDMVNYTLVTPPVVDAGPDVMVCLGGGGALIGPALQAGYTYQWSPTSGLSDPTIAQPIANPSTATTYTLLVSNGNVGCYDSDEVIVTVGGANSLTVADAATCPADSISIGVVDAGGTYSWSPTTGLGNPNSAQTNALPAVTTTYTLTWVTPDGCSVSDEMIVHLGEVPILNTLTPTICEGESIEIGPVEQTGITYNWTSISGDPIATLSATNIATPIASPTQTSVYRVTANSPTGCSSEADVTVSVNGIPEVDLGVDYIVCGLDTLEAENAGVATPGFSYLWNTLDIDAFLPISITETTTYSVRVTNSEGCSAADTITVSPPYELDAGISRNICPGAPTAIGMPDLGAGYTYAWSPSTGLSSTTISNPIASPTTTITYVLTVDDGAGCILTDAVTLTMKPTPTLAVIDAQTVCNGSCTSININMTPEAGVSYFWSPATGLNTTTGTSVIACPSTSTTYTITAVNEEGCATTTTTMINVIPDPPPAVEAGTDQTICSGETVQLGATGSAGITYYWSSPDADGVTALSNPYISNPTATINNTSDIPQVRTFIVEALDNTSLCSNTDTVRITVGNYPAITVNSIPTICLGGDLTLNSGNISYSGYNNTYLWSPAANVSDPTAAYPILTGTDTTVLTLIVTDAVTGCANFTTIDLNIADEIIGGAGDDQTVCLNELVRIGSPAQAGVSYSWWSRWLEIEDNFNTSNIWYVNGTNRGFAQPFPRTNSTGFDRIYRLQATGTSGCILVDEVTIIVEPAASINAGDDQFVCGSTPATLTASDPGVGTGIWTQISGPNTATFADNTLRNTEVSGLLNGVYNFKWAVSGVICNPGADSVLIEVVDAPNLVTNAVFTCDGDAADLTATTVTMGSTNLGNLTYWANAVATIQLARPDSITIPGIYYIKTLTAEGCEAINPVQVLFGTCDWGDLPDISSNTNVDDYQTTAANNGPSHLIITGLSLGNTVDGESDGQPSSNALGDGEDEDGIMMFTSLDLYPGQNFRLPFSYTNTTGNTAHVESWIDWNGNGEFEASEMVADWDDSAGNFPDRMEITIPSTAKLDALLGWRVRISHQDNMTPYGLVNSGEVEDYLLGIACPQVCVPIQVTVIKK